MLFQSIFNKIYIIESLRDKDLKTGQHLYDDIEMWIKIKGIEDKLFISIQKIVSKSDLLNQLQTIRYEAEKAGFFPLLHIDCHGDKEGLQLKNGDVITWVELRTYLIDINRACRVNLIITLAACEGIHLINTAIKMDYAPYLCLIASDQKITQRDVEEDFSAFYRSLFEGLSGQKFDLAEAMTALNARRYSQYSFHDTESLFKKAFAKYMKNHANKKALEKRINDILTQARKHPAMKKQPVNRIRRMIKAGLKDHARHFRKFKEKYFFMDLYPENEQRFSFSLEDTLLEGSRD